MGDRGKGEIQGKLLSSWLSAETLYYIFTIDDKANEKTVANLNSCVATLVDPLQGVAGVSWRVSYDERRYFVEN